MLLLDMSAGKETPATGSDKLLEDPVSARWDRYFLKACVWLAWVFLYGAFVIFVDPGRGTALRFVFGALWVVGVCFLAYDLRKNVRLKRRGEWPAPGSQYVAPRRWPDESDVTLMRRRRAAKQKSSTPT